MKNVKLHVYNVVPWHAFSDFSVQQKNNSDQKYV